MGPLHEAADYAAAYPAYPVRTPMTNILIVLTRIRFLYIS
jgi:hypothetical protein